MASMPYHLILIVIIIIIIMSSIGVILDVAFAELAMTIQPQLARAAAAAPTISPIQHISAAAAAASSNNSYSLQPSNPLYDSENPFLDPKEHPKHENGGVIVRNTLLYMNGDNGDGIRIDGIGNLSGNGGNDPLLLLGGGGVGSVTMIQLTWESGVVATVLGTLILLMVVGNLFVIFAIILERDLQRPQYYLILSLAVADLMVGIIVSPLASVYQIERTWRMGVGLCDFWISMDVLACTSSILHLVAIAIDRYWSITDIIYSQKRTPKRIGLMLLVVWCLSGVISVLPILGWKDGEFQERVVIGGECLISQELSYQIFSTTAAFYFPLICIILVYWKIFKAARRRIRKGRQKRQSPAHTLTTSSLPMANKKSSQSLLPKITECPPTSSDDSVAAAAAVENNTIPKTTTSNSYNNNTMLIIINNDNKSVGSSSVNKNNSNNNIDEDGDDSADYQQKQQQQQSSDDLINNIPDPNERDLMLIPETIINSNNNNNNAPNNLHVPNNAANNQQAEHHRIFDHHQQQTSSIKQVTSLNSLLQLPSSTATKATTLSTATKATTLSTATKATTLSTAAKPLFELNNEHENKQQSEDSVVACSAAVVNSNSSKQHQTNLKTHQQHQNGLGIHQKLMGGRWKGGGGGGGGGGSGGGGGGHRESAEAKRERKAWRTLAIITGTFVGSWLPFFILAIARPLCAHSLRNEPTERQKSACRINPVMESVFLWLGYLNSAVNPIIYTIFSPDFRLAFKRILKRICFLS